MTAWEKNVNKKGESRYSLDLLQRMALGGMFVLTLLTFVGANFHAYLWKSSDWLVSTVLPAVVVSLTNAERSDIAEAPLRRSATLDAAAKMKAEHMAKNEYFSHYAPDGTSPWFWFDRAGYVYAHAGENLAIHFSDSSEVVDAWMNSPTHRANIVGSQYTEIGVGTAKGQYEGYDTVYVVQLFGTPAKPVAVAPKPAPKPAPVVAQVVAEAPAPTAVPPTPISEPEKVENTDVLSATDPAPVTPSTTTPETVATTSTSTPVLSTTGSQAKESVPATPVARKELPTLLESTIATSSGLIALLEQATTTDKAPVAGVITKPSTLLQIIYTLFGFIVIGLLVGAAIMEVKRDRYVQVAYSLGLLVVMGGLWYIHSLLTVGAVII